MISLEDAERKYYEILEGEKMQYKKKEMASREIIQEISKKLKVHFITLFHIKF